MVDRYTKTVLTVIAVLLACQLARPLLDASVARAQPPATPQPPATTQPPDTTQPPATAPPPAVTVAPLCGTVEAPCLVSIVGGPPAGAWQGAPIFVFDPRAETRAQVQPPPCGMPNSAPCRTVIVGGPTSITTWQGAPVTVIESQRIVPRTGP